MLLENDKLIIKIGSAQFNSHLGENPQYQLDPTAVVGWYDGVDASRTDAKRPLADGDYSELSTMSSRAITISGSAIALSGSGLMVMRDEFMGLLVNGKYRRIAVTDNSGTRYMQVGLGSAPRWTKMLDNVAVWKLDLYAPDPYLYSAKKEKQIYSPGNATGGISYPIDCGAGLSFNTTAKYQNVTLENEGNVPSWPVFTVRGEYPSGFKIRSPKGREIIYKGVVSHSAPIVIDTAKGSAVTNGVDRSYLLTKRQWFSIPPNSSIRPVFLPFTEGDGWIDVDYYSTWV